MTVINFDWDEVEDNIVAELDDAGNTVATYTTEPTRFGNVISQNRGGVTSYFHHDGIGNTITVTDENGNVTDTRSYNAFGEITESTGTTEFPFQYVGQKGYYRDEETGEYSVRRRPYEPKIARWKSVDPLGLFDHINLYQYALNNSTNKRDPSGLLYWEGPEAAYVSFIDSFAPTAELFEEFQVESRRAGLDVELSVGDYVRVMTLLEQLAKSANPRPAARYANWKTLMKSKEFRGFIRAQMQIECTCGIITDQRINWATDPGWTPIRMFGDYERGEGESKNRMTFMVNMNSANSSNPAPPGSGCVTGSFEHQFRIGWVGQMIAEFGFGSEVPWAWGDIEYTLCCSGAYRIQFSGSHFPSHFAYLNGVQIGKIMQQDLARFTFRNPGSRAEGFRQLRVTGTARPRATWTITDSSP